MAPAPARTLTQTEAAALALLSIEGERSGYDLLKQAEKSIAHVWAPARSQLYATLNRLVRAGLVQGRVVAQTTRPDRRLYRITPVGTEALDAWLATVEPGNTSSFILRVFVAGLMPRETLVRHVEQYRLDTLERIDQLRELENLNSRRGHDYFHHLTLRYAIPQLEEAVRWTDEVLAELASTPARAVSRQP